MNRRMGRLQPHVERVLKQVRMDRFEQQCQPAQLRLLGPSRIGEAGTVVQDLQFPESRRSHLRTDLARDLLSKSERQQPLLIRFPL